MTTYQKLKEELREDFETLFEKDEEASLGIRPSKSNRSAALVLWAGWEVVLQKALEETRAETIEETRQKIKNLKMIDEKWAHWAKKQILDWCFPILNE